MILPIGMKVRIKSELPRNEAYGFRSSRPQFTSCLGKVYPIGRGPIDHVSGKYYYLNGTSYSWHESWFDPFLVGEPL